MIWRIRSYIPFLFFILIEKIFLGYTTSRWQNEGAQSRSIKNPLRRIPQFDELVDFVEETLLYQTLYLEFYSKSKWLKYKHRLFINQLCKGEEMQNSSSFYFYFYFYTWFDATRRAWPEYIYILCLKKTKRSILSWYRFLDLCHQWSIADIVRVNAISQERKR